MDWNTTFEMAALSLAAYEDDSDAIKEWYPNSIFLRHPRTGTEIYAVAGNGMRVIVLRGSDALNDWFWNLCLVRRCNNDVHRGMQAAADEVLKDPILIAFLKEHENEGGIILTGHSRGGSIAQVMAPEMGDVMAVFGFGCSRVGGRRWRRAYNSIDVPTYLFENRGDIIPNLPPWYFGYVHVVKPMSLDGKGHDMGEYLEDVNKRMAR
jgi:hypothetical protein